MTQTARYYETAGYSMIDHQLDPLIDVTWSWLTHNQPTDAERKRTAEAIAETLEALAAFIRSAGERATPLDIECLTCGASTGQPCWTTEEEARAIVNQLSDADLIDRWGGADELRSYVTVPTLAEMRAGEEEDQTYEDRGEPHPNRVEDASHLYKLDVER